LTQGYSASTPKVSIVIKALNEQATIARAIESSLKAVSECAGGGEVILADSLSTDRTVEIGRQFPIRIVQLCDGDDRCCGVGAQLGYLISKGEFVYVLDGDMELIPGFLTAALQVLESNPDLAGVAGLVEEQVVVNHGFKRRIAGGDTARPCAKASALNMGGLYRRSAIESVGYLTNRNLHAFEEFELGVRLISCGWRLSRIATPAVRHYGHADASLQLLRRRWRSRYAWGHGEVLRSAARKQYLGRVICGLPVYRIQFGVAASWLLALAALLAWPSAADWLVGGLAAGYAMLFIVIAWRKRSAGAAAYALAAWHMGLAGLVRGVLSPARGNPGTPPAFKVIK
jgi:glycosyltransferase involved in cell wall biosynthesis